jgi:predicted lipid-binding transport protein (Tim44 family)
MDILFFALLSFYIFYKLSKHLGQVDENEKRDMEEKIARIKASEKAIMDKIKEQEVVIGASSTINSKEKESEDKILATLPDTLKQSLNDIFSRCNITLSFFLFGAKSAFEMIIKAFASGDLSTLKMLLADKIYQGFENAVNARNASGNALVTNLIAIEKSEIIGASLVDNFANIVVKFTSKQINYITDQSGAVVEGNKGEIAEITDIWTFKKDVTSPNPNWIVSATGS